jgi:thiosulfate/3-mercaptopyruvate sulfurtransferase
VTILDVRSQEEYLGEKSEAARAGHIPSAVQIDFQESLRRVGGICYVKGIDDLRSAYAGVCSDCAVITYCNTGTRASASYLALRLLGREVAVYDGAWTEWAGDASLPIEVAPPAPAARH